MPDLIAPPVRAKGMVHKIIAEVAKGCAEAQYEVLAKQNAFYRRWPKVKPYVVHNWRHYVPAARQILTGMLGNQKYTEDQKAAIYEALMLDGAINPKKMAEPAKPVITFSDKPEKTPC